MQLISTQEVIELTKSTKTKFRHLRKLEGFPACEQRGKFCFFDKNKIIEFMQNNPDYLQKTDEGYFKYQRKQSATFKTKSRGMLHNTYCEQNLISRLSISFLRGEYSPNY